MSSTFENIRYKKTTCVIFTKDEISQSPIRKVKINSNLWTRKHQINGKRCCFKEMNLNAYVLKAPTTNNLFKNDIATRIMGFIIIGPAIIFSSNGFHLSIEDIDKITTSKTQEEVEIEQVTNLYEALACSDDEE